MCKLNKPFPLYVAFGHGVFVTAVESKVGQACLVCVCGGGGILLLSESVVHFWKTQVMADIFMSTVPLLEQSEFLCLLSTDAGA